MANGRRHIELLSGVDTPSSHKLRVVEVPPPQVSELKPGPREVFVLRQLGSMLFVTGWGAVSSYTAAGHQGAIQTFSLPLKALTFAVI